MLKKSRNKLSFTKSNRFSTQPNSFSHFLGWTLLFLSWNLIWHVVKYASFLHPAIYCEKGIEAIGYRNECPIESNSIFLLKKNLNTHTHIEYNTMCWKGWEKLFRSIRFVPRAGRFHVRWSDVKGHLSEAY